MTREELVGRRWAAQRLNPDSSLSPEQTVASMGAVQAQDLPSALTAIALRCPGTTATVQAALDEGRLVRTHVLRPTWHVVAAADLRWMMQLTGPRISQGGAGRFREVGLPPEVRMLSRKTIEKALARGPLTRDELKATLADAGVPTEGQALVHCLMDAELELVICNGPRGKGSTYDLVDRRVPPAPAVAAEEALARLARRYIQGHGPATDKDFSWWSGLPLGAARRGLDACGPDLETSPWNDSRVWFDPRFEPVAPAESLWLPAYDEFIIAYADRSAVLPPSQTPRAISSNGIFWPTVLVNGVVAGTWGAPLKRGARPVTVEWFGAPPVGAEEARQAWEAKLHRISLPQSF